MKRVETSTVLCWVMIAFITDFGACYVQAWRYANTLWFKMGEECLRKAIGQNWVVGSISVEESYHDSGYQSENCTVQAEARTPSVVIF